MDEKDSGKEKVEKVDYQATSVEIQFFTHWEAVKRITKHQDTKKLYSLPVFLKKMLYASCFKSQKKVTNKMLDSFSKRQQLEGVTSYQ